MVKHFTWLNANDNDGIVLHQKHTMNPAFVERTRLTEFHRNTLYNYFGVNKKKKMPNYKF